jgi:cytochrome c5
MRIVLFAASALALFAICADVSGQSQAPAPAPAKKQKQAATTKSAADQTQTAKSTADQEQKEGKRRFYANCGRCHNLPESSITRREVKAVEQHMRVRAMLSAQDEELILKYLAP